MLVCVSALKNTHTQVGEAAALPHGECDAHASTANSLHRYAHTLRHKLRLAYMHAHTHKLHVSPRTTCCLMGSRALIACLLTHTHTLSLTVPHSACACECVCSRPLVVVWSSACSRSQRAKMCRHISTTSRSVRSRSRRRCCLLISPQPRRRRRLHYNTQLCMAQVEYCRRCLCVFFYIRLYLSVAQN